MKQIGGLDATAMRSRQRMILFTLDMLLLLLLPLATAAFAPVPLPQQQQQHLCFDTTFGFTRTTHRKLTVVSAKKKEDRGGRKKGFGKAQEPPKQITNLEETTPLSPPAPTFSSSSSRPSSAAAPSLLQSVEKGGSNAVPVIEQKVANDDDKISVEERAQNLLRNKYGLKTLEEQRLSEKQLEIVRERQKKLAEWKKKANEGGDDFDIMTALPAPVLLGIDRFLKIGLALSGVAFLSAGMAITLEAWSKTSGNALPADLDQFIVESVEPYFTTGLFVLLGFSVSLGLFAAAQLGSSGAQYREK